MRVKRGVTTHKRHKKLLAHAKGYRGGRSKLIKLAKEAVIHAGVDAYRGRKEKKRTNRSLWITRINGALTPRKLLMKLSKKLASAELTKKFSIDINHFASRS